MDVYIQFEVTNGLDINDSQTEFMAFKSPQLMCDMTLPVTKLHIRCVNFF